MIDLVPLGLLLAAVEPIAEIALGVDAVAVAGEALVRLEAHHDRPLLEYLLHHVVLVRHTVTPTQVFVLVNFKVSA